MNIGNPVREVTVEPLDVPAEPVRVPEPTTTPEPEKVPAGV